MKRHIDEDGTRTHELNGTEKRAVRKTITIVDELAYFYRDTKPGRLLSAAAEYLLRAHNGEPICVETPEDEE